ncbi:olfactory receptor 10AG1-like [Monodelphis domestica]|uniref:olfactory receptor 10AG1-like n=1 Tax=Monodelphis domestica TaxID=13616 RepID=UPI0024E1E6C0|nr:olfactory receptor 10AG1-like [Monodelphis domestica]
MAEVNITLAVEFFFLGFADLPNLQGFLFLIFLIIYLSILIGNGLIIVITKLEPSLQTPMYFFLGNFSFLEICYTSVTLPKMLIDLWTQKRKISFLGCATQLFFILILGVTECFLLSVMAYDRFVAICKPLYYTLIMNHTMCVWLVIGSWIIGIPILIGLTYQIFSLPFCGSNKLEHVFCDIPPLLKVACGDISMEEYSIYVDAGIFGMFPFLFISGSYAKIIAAILKLPSSKGRYKAFFTCSSHLIVVTLYFGSAGISYLMPNSSHSTVTEILFSLFYTILTPLFNPLIYSLRNKDFIVAMRKLLPKCVGLRNT